MGNSRRALWSWGDLAELILLGHVATNSNVQSRLIQLANEHGIASAVRLFNAILLEKYKIIRRGPKSVTMRDLKRHELMADIDSKGGRKRVKKPK